MIKKENHIDAVSILSSLLLLLISFQCYAQQDSCYQQSWTKRIAKKVPANICIGEDEVIYQLFSGFDFNQDGRSDIAIKVGNEEKTNGDTTVLIIFEQQFDSTFVGFMSLNNVFPIYFEKYSLDYVIQNEKLLKIKNRYQETYPLERIEIDNEDIHIYMVADATAVFHLVYSYNTSDKDWLLSKLLVDDEETNDVTDYETFRIGTSINDFNYFHYIEGDF